MTANPFKWIRLHLRARRLESTGLFDKNWYIQNNSDVDFSEVSPAIHWLKTGWLEGRNPHPCFDTNWYLSRHPDVAKSGMNPLEHYQDFGAAEGRDPHPAFLTNWYLHEYPDATGSHHAPNVHYWLVGRRNGYKPHPVYDDIESWNAPQENPRSRAGLDIHSSSLKVGFAVSDNAPDTTAGDCFTAWELGTALNDTFGWEFQFLARNNPTANWYDVSGLDILIVMLDDYDLQRIYNGSDILITVAWARNWFDRWASRPWIKSYSIHLCSSDHARSFFNREHDIDARVFRLATNPTRFHESVEADPKYACDYCFTGNYWGSPREIEKFQAEKLPFEFAIFGSGWEEHSNFAQFQRGQIPYNQINNVYASTKLLIDDANHVTKPWGSVNSRVFDAIASGVLVITNGAVGAKETFDNLLPVYDSVSGLEDLISHFLLNDAERTARLKRLQKIVLEENTYPIRAKQLRAIIGEFQLKPQISGELRK